MCVRRVWLNLSIFFTKLRRLPLELVIIFGLASTPGQVSGLFYRCKLGEGEFKQTQLVSEFLLWEALGTPVLSWPAKE